VAHSRLSRGSAERLGVLDSPTMEIAKTSARVATVRPRTSRFAQAMTLVAVIVPPLGIVSAMGLLWGVAFHWVDLAVLAVFYTVCAFGTTIGFHRYFSHRSFEACAPVKLTLAILGCMTMQGQLTQWVTDHRKHHAFSDRVGCVPGVRPRARRLDVLDAGNGARARIREGPLRGSNDPDDRSGLLRLGCDDARHSIRDRLLDRWGRRGLRGSRLGWADPDLPLPACDVRGELDLSHVRAARLPGSRRVAQQSRRRSARFREGWHNNHHAFPSSARHGLAWWQYDLSWWIIRGLEKLGLVWDVKLPTADQMRKRAVVVAQA